MSKRTTSSETDTMKSIYRMTSNLRVLATLSLLLLPAQAVEAEPQPPVSVTCINLAAEAGQGPRHRFVICTPHGCFVTKEVPGPCHAQ